MRTRRFALRADPPRRASVNERGGTDVLVPGYLYHFSLDAKAAGAELMPTARAVVDALRPFDNTLDPQRLAEQASSSKQPLSLITLRQSDHDRVAAAIGALPGVVITPQAELLPTDEISRRPSSTRSRRPWSTNSTATPAGASSASTRTASTSTCSTRCPASRRRR